MIEVQEIQVKYTFSNPLFDQGFDSSTSRAWKQMIFTVLEDKLKDIGLQSFEITSEDLKDLVSLNNPEKLVDPLSYEIEIHEELQDNHQKLFLDMQEDSYLILTVNHYDEIILFDRFLLNNFPTYQQSDAKIKPQEEEHRLPISLIPKRDLQYVVITGSEEFLKFAEECKISLYIEVDYNLVPTREIIYNIIRGHINHELKSCQHQDHPMWKKLSVTYSLPEEYDDLISEINAL